MKLEFRKLKADEIDVRVGTVIKTTNYSGVSLLLYKDARVDQNILDETVGATNWQRRHVRDNANCIVSIWDDDKKQWVEKEDTGTESNTEAEKGLASDSFKRACVNWGIGRELYTAPKNLLVKCEVTVDDKGRKSPAKGLSWYVKEIGYDNGVISSLVIGQKQYDKDVGEVYRMEAPKFATAEQVEYMRKLGVNEANVLKRYNIAKLEELKGSDAEFVIKSKEKALGLGE